MTDRNFTLTKDNYFDPSRPHLSVSQVKCYLKSPDLYYRRYVLKDPKAQFVPTPSMVKGSLVDDLVTRGQTDIQKKVTKKEDPELYAAQQDLDPSLLITSAQYDEAMEVVEELKRQPIWCDNVAGSEFQVLLENYLSPTKGRLVPICGLVDRVSVDPETGIHRIIDLKVTAPGNQKHFRHFAVEMGYDMQLAVYRWLYVSSRELTYDDIICSNVVVSRIEPGYVKVMTHTWSPDRLEYAFGRFERAVGDISAGRFGFPRAEWDDPKEPIGFRTE